MTVIILLVGNTEGKRATVTPKSDIMGLDLAITVFILFLTNGMMFTVRSQG